MIERYVLPEMNAIWSEEEKIKRWLLVEFQVVFEMFKQDKITKKEWRRIELAFEKLIAESAKLIPEIVEEERKTRHDVIAFINVVSKKLRDKSRYLHLGLTSSDVIDTALALALFEAGKILQSDIKELTKTLKKMSLRYKDLETIGRSHGRYAEPTSFGLKFLGYYTEWQRNAKRLDAAISSIQYGKISGPVGNSSYWGVRFEKNVLKALGLKRESVSTQIVPRDRHAELLSVMAICGSSLERMSVEFRHLQRSEVGEIEEGFSIGQKGSSAMPHKKNPIASENITGLARLLRSYAQAALENIALWHERDISHSSVERVIIPDAFCVLNYALNRMNHTLNNLVVNKKMIARNLNVAKEEALSGKVMTALIEKGMKRQDAYDLVQNCVLKKENFFQLAYHKHISQKELELLLNANSSMKNIPAIYKEVL